MVSINTNQTSIITQNSMKLSTGKLNQAIERLSSGYKINSAKDNAANYYIATSMESKLSAYQIAEDNIAQGLDMITTASDTLTELEDKLNRLKALQTQVMNGGYGGASLKSINAEANAILKEIDRLHKTTEYNGINLFDSVPKKTADFQTPTLNGKGFIADIEYIDTKGMTRLSEIANKNASLTDGTYAICDLEDLLTLAEMSQNSYISSGDTFVMGADIDLKEHCEANVATGGWEPIKNFKGTFDGNGHTISNLKINRPTEDSQGLFSILYGVTVENVKLENIDIVGQKNVGGLAGSVGYSSIADNISVSGSVQGIENVGGIVGYALAGSSFDNHYSSATVKGELKVGCAFGFVYSGVMIFDSLSSGDVYGVGSGSDIGGVIGKFQSSSAEDIYATSNVYAPNSQNVGGLVGNYYYSTIKNCYSTGNVEGWGNVGGIFGFSYDDIAHSNHLINAYATGNVKGNSTVGGIAGNLYGTLENCTFKGELQATLFNLGGIAGVTNYGYAIIKNCSFEGTGDFNANDRGLLVGRIAPSVSSDVIIEDCQVVSAVENAKGVFVGTTGGNSINLTISNCKYNSYYDKLNTPLINNLNANTVLNMENNKASDFKKTVELQVGINGDNSNQIDVVTSFELNEINNLSNIGLDSDTDYISLLDSYLDLISQKQTELGATQNRLMSALDSITVNIQNLASSRSTIRDADMAELSSTYIQQQILQDASATLMATSQNLRAESLIGIIQSLS